MLAARVLLIMHTSMTHMKTWKLIGASAYKLLIIITYTYNDRAYIHVFK